MVRLFKHYIPHAVVLLVALELVLLLCAAEAAWHLRIWQIGSVPGLLRDRLSAMAIFAAAVQLSLIGVGGYAIEALRSVRVAATRLVVALLLAVLVISVVAFLLPGDLFWRSILLYAVAFAFAGIILLRVLAGPLLGTATFVRRVVVMGAGARAARLHRLSGKPNAGFHIAAFIDMRDAPVAVPSATERVDIPDLARFIDRMQAGEVVLALQERRNALPLQDLLRVKTGGVQVTDFSSFLERETGRVDLDTLNPSWLIFSDGFAYGARVATFAKRGFDILTSLGLLLLTWPVIVVGALLVKLESAGPAFFRQTRIGLNGEPFVLVKLRSMRVDAERDGAQWAQENDPRVTRIGKLLRTLRIDELPQLYTVLRGRMSFVGPRPEVPTFVDRLTDELPYYAERHMVKPGITGWAQINFPYGASLEDSRHKLEYDLYYAKNYSPFLDLLILLQTIRVILWPGGAR